MPHSFKKKSGRVLEASFGKRRSPNTLKDSHRNGICILDPELVKILDINANSPLDRVLKANRKRQTRWPKRFSAEKGACLLQTGEMATELVAYAYFISNY